MAEASSCQSNKTRNRRAVTVFHLMYKYHTFATLATSMGYDFVHYESAEWHVAQRQEGLCWSRKERQCELDELKARNPWQSVWQCHFSSCICR